MAILTYLFCIYIIRQSITDYNCRLIIIIHNTLLTTPLTKSYKTTPIIIIYNLTTRGAE